MTSLGTTVWNFSIELFWAVKIIVRVMHCVAHLQVLQPTLGFGCHSWCNGRLGGWRPGPRRVPEASHGQRVMLWQVQFWRTVMPWELWYWIWVIALYGSFDDSSTPPDCSDSSDQLTDGREFLTVRRLLEGSVNWVFAAWLQKAQRQRYRKSPREEHCIFCEKQWRIEWRSECCRPENASMGIRFVHRWKWTEWGRTGEHKLYCWSVDIVDSFSVNLL